MAAAIGRTRPLASDLVAKVFVASTGWRRRRWLLLVLIVHSCCVARVAGRRWRRRLLLHPRRCECLLLRWRRWRWLMLLLKVVVLVLLLHPRSLGRQLLRGSRRRRWRWLLRRDVYLNLVNLMLREDGLVGPQLQGLECLLLLLCVVAVVGLAQNVSNVRLKCHRHYIICHRWILA